MHRHVYSTFVHRHVYSTLVLRRIVLTCMSVTENSKRNLRKQPRRDYKSMSRGEPEVIESLEENVPPGASGGFDSFGCFSTTATIV